MKKVFADTSYWIALLNSRDELHIRAKSVSKSLEPFITVTSEMVLTEILDHFARRGIILRKGAVNLVKNLKNDPNTKIVSQSNIQFMEALSLYDKRSDKEWSLTDCSSILIMETNGIKEALSYDKNFSQAGFYALLRDQN